MQRCVNCRTSFTWKQINKSLWLAYKPVACLNCGMLHKVQFLSRILASMMMVGPLFILNFLSPFAGAWNFIISVLLVMPTVILLLPYIMRYRLA
ncbi:TIGR04104 family putative zinc finger protein [uncultured Planococcus sp.]|uniref:TIGR04104 family putative zinc finger protein n=1 Tax=Planococcus donghaensis TaxID=414778 RepID=UPI00262C3EB4|nr:TIGR04104 family putative zinc finger protein [uncultured Planococcus sp.]